MKCSKNQLQSELDDSWIGCIGDAAKVAVAQVAIGRREVGVISGIEELRAKLGVDPFRDRGDFAHGKIGSDQSRTGGGGAPRGAVADVAGYETLRRHVAFRLEESVDSLLAAGDIGITNQVRPESAVSTHTARISRSHNRHRISGLQRQDTIHRPSADKPIENRARASPELSAFSERQFINESVREALTVIQFRKSLLRLSVKDILHPSSSARSSSAETRRVGNGF